jgi:hypothetical protein
MPEKKPKAVPKETKKPPKAVPKETKKPPKAVPKVAKKPPKAVPKVAKKPPRAVPKETKKPPKVIPKETKKPPRATVPKETKKPPKATPKETKKPPKVIPKETKKPPKAVPKVAKKPPKAVPKVAKKPPKAVPKVAKKPPKATPKTARVRIYNLKKRLRKSQQSSRQKVIRRYVVKMYGGLDNNEDPKNTSLEGRIAKYKVITTTLKPEGFTESCLEKDSDDSEKYKIKDRGAKVVLELSRKKGVSISANSYIYNTNVKHKTDEHITYDYEIVSKLMIPYQQPKRLNGKLVNVIALDNENKPINKYNVREIKLMETITSSIITNELSRHFLLMYFYSMCNISVPIDALNPYDRSRSFVIYTEPANGDVETLLNNEVINLDNETILNAFIQSIISLGTFHNNFGYIHNDCHMGNFLYQDNSQHKEGILQYYQYTFNNNDYLLKSCKYNIMIYDFGLSIKIADIPLSVNIITSIILDNIKNGDIKKIEYPSKTDSKIYEYDITYKSTNIFNIIYKDDNYDIEETNLKEQIGKNIIENHNNPLTRNKYIKYINKYIQKQLKEDYKTLVIFFVDEIRDKVQQIPSILDRLDDFLTQIDISINVENIIEDGDIIDCETYIFQRVINEVIGLCNNDTFKSLFFNKISQPDIASTSIINAKSYKISK